MPLGHCRASGRKMEKFSVSVNIAGKSSVIFTLVYEELLQRKLGKYEILTRVKIEQPVQKFQVEHILLFYWMGWRQLCSPMFTQCSAAVRKLWQHEWDLLHHADSSLDLNYCVSVRQILTDIYEPQGITSVEPTATFLTNELLHLIETTVTDTSVKG